MAQLVSSVALPVGTFDSGPLAFTGSGVQITSLSVSPVGPANLPGTATLTLRASTGGVFFDAIAFPCWFGLAPPHVGGTPVPGGSALDGRVDTTGWTTVRVLADVTGGPVSLSAAVN